MKVYTVSYDEPYYDNHTDYGTFLKFESAHKKLTELQKDDSDNVENYYITAQTIIED